MSYGIEVPESALLAVKHRAQESPDEEVCGAILRGEHIAVNNVIRSSRRDKSFKMDPSHQMEIWNRWKREGDLIIYHSHPKAGTYPSAEDKWVITRSADVIFLIYSVVRDAFNAYRWNGFAIVNVEIISVGESTQQSQRGTVTNGTN